MLHPSLAWKNHSMLRWRYWLAGIATATLIPVVLLGIAEATLRLCGVGTSTALTVPCSDQGRPAFCDNPFFTKTFFSTGMARTARPYAIPAEKPPGTFRIFILGESAAEGDPDPTYGFGRYLEVMLRERFPGVKFEVINTSITASNSHVILPIARDLAHHQPDLVLLYVGNNEVVGPFGPGTVLTPAAMSLPVIRARIFLNSTKVGQLVAKLGQTSQQRPPEWRGMEMFLGQQVRADSPAMEHVYGNFATNLRDIVAVARRSGARVVVSTIATNLKDSAPFASEHRPGLEQDRLRAWEGLVQRGAELDHAGAYTEALKLYVAAADIDDQYAELQFRIARCLWSLGDFPAAKERFVRAQDLDTLRFRTDSRTNEIIRSVAGAGGPGVDLVDAAAIFAQESPHGVPGSELFYEHVHMNPQGNYLLASALFHRVANALPPGTRSAASASDVPSEEECERLLALTPYDRSRLARLSLRKLERPPFTSQLNHVEQVLRLRLEAEATSEGYDEIVAQYRWAIAQNPEDRLLHLNYGFVLYQRNPASATPEFRLALPYDNAPVLCNWRKFN